MAPEDPTADAADAVQRHERAKAVFAGALARPEAARQAYVREACGDDAGLLAEVEGLLRHHQLTLGIDPDGKTESDSAPPFSPIAVDPLIGSTVAGKYHILGVIGEGGFGVVYEAEQTRPVRRRVALKVIKPGMDSKAVIARFEAERQALAVMDHPCIAKVHDAGETDRGLPFFVMELVKGSPITDYCDRNRLTITQRLELFARVCDAIQHAHTKAIIHRDIKPSNILVEVREGGEPTPKVIDFGIAKAMAQKLTERTLFTEQGQMIGTPEYMSPEQAEMSGEDIDTRSDVYSLGVLLYELLTGERPFDLRQAAFIEIQRVIRETEPPKPSTRLTGLGETGTRIAECRRTDLRSLSGTLRRELEWIPLRALRKDRTERYRTAADLGDDVRRYLAGEALEAGPPSTAYRLRKFARRYKGPVAAVAAVFLVLVLGIVGTGYGVISAEREAERANAEAIRANEEATAAREAEQEQARLAAEAARERDAATKARDAADLARAEIEYGSYVANVQMAEASLEMGLFGRVRARLDAAPEAYRGWDWYWLDARFDRSLAALIGHTGGVLSASFSPDGTRIVTASTDKTARVWDAVTGASLAELTGHTGRVVSASFSPDGTRVVTASYDRTARVWDAVTGASLAELAGHTESLFSASFSPDGTRVVTASNDHTARVWDASTGASVAELIGHTDPVYSGSFSPDGTRIVTVSNDKTARVWDASTGESLAGLTGHTDWVSSASFSPDGTRIVTASTDKTARVWDVSTGAVAEMARHTESLFSASFSPDGTRVVTASNDKTARVWNAVTGASLAELAGHKDPVFSASFSPEGTQIVTASSDGTARVWDTSTGAPLAELARHTDPVFAASFSPDGTRVVTASSDGTARVWDTSTGASVAELAGHTGRVLSAAFSPDGTRVVTASSDGTARVWDASTGASVTELAGHTESLFSASFSPDGTRVVTASSDGTARVWDTSTGASVTELAGHIDSVYSASFSPDGTRVVTASSDGTARVWDTETGALLAELTGHPGEVFSASFSPDGTRIVTASSDNSARVWDASTGASVAELAGHIGSVYSASFSPDGTRIVTASGDKTARIWDAVHCRIRYAEREANARGEDGSAIVKAWTEESGFNTPPAKPPSTN
jgi:WD40 repeat protein/serine/threonine protein kinase